MPNNTRKNKYNNIIFFNEDNVKTYRKSHSLGKRRSPTTAVVVGVVVLASLGLGLGLTLTQPTTTK